MFRIFQLTEQYMYLITKIKNPMFCTYVLHKWHGEFFGAHSRIFFLNSVGETNPFDSVGKMSHIFGPKLDIVSEPYMMVLMVLTLPAVLRYL